jgi:hypothetical protein
LGICDTLYVETFNCDHIYNAAAGYDSVRVAIYVTHDSNTFFWEDQQRWVQDSISGFVIPLVWRKVGCADSLVFPTYGDWNNKIADRAYARFKRSIFRDLVDAHTGDTVYNRYAHIITDLGWNPWSVSTMFLGDSAFFYLIAPAYGKWWEGSRVLLATFTFLVYMGDTCDSTAICLDSTFWPPSDMVCFTRFDAINYVPRHFLPVCDTIYIPLILGDTNRDGVINSADVSYLINYLFVSGPAPHPLEAGDTNCDSNINSADAAYLINYLFVNGPPPGCP